MKDIEAEYLMESFRKQIELGLPGLRAHKRNAPFARFDGDYNPNPVGSRKSAVLILLYKEEDVLKLVLFKRTEDGGPHSGQISFPGGKVEKGDSTIEYTALRETFEEVGVRPESVMVIGAMTPVYITVSNFSVQPILGYTNLLPKFVVNATEVQELVLPSVEELFANENRYTKLFNRNRITFEAVCLNANGHEVWGATAIILAELEEMCMKIGLI